MKPPRCARYVAADADLSQRADDIVSHPSHAHDRTHLETQLTSAGSRGCRRDDQKWLRSASAPTARLPRTGYTGRLNDGAMMTGRVMSATAGRIAVNASGQNVSRWAFSERDRNHGVEPANLMIMARTRSLDGRRFRRVGRFTGPGGAARLAQFLGRTRQIARWSAVATPLRRNERRVHAKSTGFRPGGQDAVRLYG
jgi:hypothetical protein